MAAAFRLPHRAPFSAQKVLRVGARSFPRATYGWGTRTIVILTSTATVSYFAPSLRLDTPNPRPYSTADSLSTTTTSQRVSEPTPASLGHKPTVLSLSLSTLLGISTGIFLKKGLKLLGTFIGCVFVLVQYMSSRKWLQVNWPTVSDAYERRMDAWAPASEGGNRVYRLWSVFVNFVAADVPQRGTFMAGMALGLRL